ncbi:MAG: hypothetical protein K5854_06150 [Prevotella sp.]|nr:hypothetical protein [Prevotella sp.]
MDKTNNKQKLSALDRFKQSIEKKRAWKREIIEELSQKGETISPIFL